MIVKTVGVEQSEQRALLGDGPRRQDITERVVNDCLVILTIHPAAPCFCSLSQDCNLLRLLSSGIDPSQTSLGQERPGPSHACEDNYRQEALCGSAPAAPGFRRGQRK